MDKISIHTPAKGVTTGLMAVAVAKANFNPHSREGSDEATYQKRKQEYISIHTPAKGVTTQTGT